MNNSSLRPPAIAAIFAMTLALLLCAPLSRAASPELSDASREALRLGERIYREGILPSGEPLRASATSGHAAPGLTFACISCHLRSGLGAFDEGIYTPPINGAKLFRPLPRMFKGNELSIDIVEPLRPAYTDDSLIEVLRSGKGPGGRVLGDGMPRYPLKDSDARLLVSYLRSLSSHFSPGVVEQNLHFATVISDGVNSKKSEAMLGVLEQFIKNQNSRFQAASDPRSRLMAQNMMGSVLAGRSFSLSHWTLTGPPDSWRRQLEEYNRKEPPFALLGGMVEGSWQPVHRFCEDNGIPSFFPLTELPVISDVDWYTLYLSRGYYQEGESAARYLHDRGELPGGVLQLVRSSPEGEALSAGFQQTWQALGHRAPVKVQLPSGTAVDREFLTRLLDKEQPETLLLWDNAGVIPTLESVSRRDGRPGTVILSARYLGEKIWNLPESLRDEVFLTYPFFFSPYTPRSGMAAQKIPVDLKKSLRRSEVPLMDELQQTATLTKSLTQLFFPLLIELKGNYYRDNLLDTMGMMADQQYPLYGRVSFGTGSRYAAKGCHIVQLTHGADPELVKKSSWDSQ